MRPTDEDQPGSRRPNLMSSTRRSSGDVNILAMLDGLGARPQARRTRLWYGVGGVLACALVGTLAWMVRGAAPAVSVADMAPARASIPVSAPAAAPVPSPVSASVATLDAAVPPPAPGGAMVVNLPVLSSVDVERAPPPPGSAHPLAAPKHGPAQKNPLPHPAPIRNAASAHGGVHPGAKRLAGANRTASAPSAVDTDVALISAIIQHAAERRAAGEDCGDKPCGPRTPPQP